MNNNIFYIILFIISYGMFGIVWECVWKKYILLKTIAKLQYISNSDDDNYKETINMIIKILPKLNIFNFIIHIIYYKTNRKYNHDIKITKITIDDKTQKIIDDINITVLYYMLYSSFITSCITLFLYILLSIFQHIELLNKLRLKIISNISNFIFNQSSKEINYYSVNL